MQEKAGGVILITSAAMDMAIYAAWIYVIGKVWKIPGMGLFLIHIKISDIKEVYLWSLCVLLD